MLPRWTRWFQAALLYLGVALSLEAAAAERTSTPGVTDGPVDLTSELLRETSFRRSSMLTLGAWALGNLAIGGLAARSTQGDAREFWRMTAYWNVVNLGIAGFGYFGASGLPEKVSTWSELQREQGNLRGILLLNTGLDVAYIAGGWAMLERGLRRPGPDGARWRGFGRAVAVQGAFLLAFDIALLTLQPRTTAPERFAGWQVQPSAWIGAPGGAPIWGLTAGFTP